MIRIENVNKYFNSYKKNQIHVIDNTSITFPHSGIVSLLGPSGCGKTTLLNVIGGLDKVNSGHIYIDGKRITKRRSKKIDEIRNLNIGYIFQDYKLVENMTVYENVALSLKIIGIKDKKEIKKRVLYTLDKVNMLRYKNRPVNMLSGGERQRVGIARAIVKNPKIIIADEPTGNLDSKNSLEIMNIIKSISIKYLVILVTHEVNLAKFYADRIIELVDGKVVKDYQNDNVNTLDYKVENKIYLKDFKYKNSIKKDNININLYQEDKEDLDISVVFKNGNIYIETKDNKKIEVIDNFSSIELIDDHYKKIEKNDIDSNFDIEIISNKDYKYKYSSIFNLFSFIKYGFKKVIDYPILKKILLIGFFLSGMFINYSISSIFATINIDDKDFIKMNKEYLTGNVKNLKIDDYLNFENNSDISYILPSDSIINLKVDYDNYLQTQDNFGIISGSLSSIDMLKENDLLYGRMPLKENEIVIDKMVIDNFIDNNVTKKVGFFKESDLLNHKVYVDNMEKLTIVGISDINEPNIYTNNNLFINLISNNVNDYYYDDIDNFKKLGDYNLFINKSIKLTEGALPNNDYEVIIPDNYKYEYELNKEIQVLVNKKKLKVVGYYQNISNEDINLLLTNNNTLKYNLIENASNIVIYPKNKDEVLEYLQEKKINIKSSYEYSKENYINLKEESIINTLIIMSVILCISLIEILLMIRSSFLSRIKEVGTYRAIGVKKRDIYKMFSGEIFAITILSSIPGITFMSYILYNLIGIKYLENMFMVNLFTYLFSIILVLLFNLFVGLLPVFNTIRKTPADILSRIDVD